MPRLDPCGFRWLWPLALLFGCFVHAQGEDFPKLFHKALAQREMGQTQQAVETMMRAHKAAPDPTSRAKAALALGRLSQQMGSSQAAERWLRKTLEDDPAGPQGAEARRELGEVPAPSVSPPPILETQAPPEAPLPSQLSLALAGALGVGCLTGVGLGLAWKGRREGKAPRPLVVALLAGLSAALLGPVIALSISGRLVAEGSSFIPAGSLGLGILLAGLAHRLWVQGQLLKNTPFSRLRSAPQGWVKVQGNSTGEHWITSKTGGIPCIYFAENTQEYRRHTRTERDSRTGQTRTVTTYSWDTVDTASDACPFDLDDGTGRAQILPEKGEFHPQHVQQYYNGYPGSGSFSPSVGDRRTTVNFIPPASPLEIAGCLLSGTIRYDDFHRMLVVAEGSLGAGQTRRSVGGVFAGLAGFGLLAFCVMMLWESRRLQRQGMDATTISIALAVLGALVLLWLLSVYNGLISLRRQTQRAWADVDALLKQRWDLVPNLVATVKASAQHEQETLARVAEARAEAQAAPDVESRIGAEMRLGRTLPAVVAIAEAHPSLRAGTNFLHLQHELARLEESIADRREFYNHVATNYNTRLCTFPGALFKGAMGSSEVPLFAAYGAEREAATVSFGGDA